MLTPQDVRSVQFEKNLRGYRTEDVDRFLDKVEEQLRDDDAQAEQLRKQIADLTAENQKLHDELKSFEADGEMLKSALINAQRMGENVIREANQKAEDIIHRANLRGDDIIRDANELLQKANDRADEIENEANEKRLAEEREYDRVRLEVTRFKSDVLNLYRSHVESLSRLPEFQKETAAQDAEQAEPAAEEVSLPLQPSRRQRTCRSRKQSLHSPHRKMQNLLPLLKMTTTRQLTAARISGQRMRASSSWTRRPRLLLILSRTSRTTMLFRVSSSASKATP